MAATNYTPIQLYYSTTASAAPSAGNLTSGELAINITDGKLYYKDNAGNVQVIATKGAGTIGGSNTQIQYNNNGALAGNAAMTFNSGTNTVTLTTLNLTNALGATYGGTAQSSYTQGDILYSSASNTLSKLGIGTVNYILTSTGSVPQWSAPSSITVQTATNLAGGAAGSVPYQSAPDTTTFLSIGAANRVMTSSGTAPQWVTALTGLTGVSSSSITNTSLTATRLVYSSTAGLQTDSANLTFDGTTLSAAGYSTTGLSTLVKTVTIGNSNFNGTAVFAAATPAKLYIGTGTVTDTTSAIGATNATGAISSLAITPIAASNTSVTYTNASTLYIAGAPSAGTNVTITNPYALYVAGGASYFGGAVTYGAGLTLGGNLLFTPDATYNIGASGANRPANIYISGTYTGSGASITSTNATTATFADSARYALVNISSSGTNQAAYISLNPTGTGVGIIQKNGTDVVRIDPSLSQVTATTTQFNGQNIYVTGNSGSGTSLDINNSGAGINSVIQLYNQSLPKWQVGYEGAGGRFRVYNFGTSAEAFCITPGNSFFGFNCTPPAWASFSTVLQLAGNNSIVSGTGQMQMTYNTYYNGADYVRIAADTVQREIYNTSGVLWESAATGAIGSTVTFSQQMLLRNSGKLTVGPLANIYTRLFVTDGNSTRTGITLSDGNTSSLMLFAGNSQASNIAIDAYSLKFSYGNAAGTETGGTSIMTLGANGVGIGAGAAYNGSFYPLFVTQTGNEGIAANAPSGYNATLQYYHGGAVKWSVQSLDSTFLYRVFNSMTSASAFNIDASNRTSHYSAGPSPWSFGSGTYPVQFGKNAAIVADNQEFVQLISNSYYDGSNYRYISSGSATRILTDLGQYYFENSASGTAGNVNTWTRRFNINTNGYIAINNTATPVSMIDPGTSVANNGRIYGIYYNVNTWTGIGMSNTTAGVRLAGDSTGTDTVDIGYYSTNGSFTWSSIAKFNTSGFFVGGLTNPGTTTSGIIQGSQTGGGAGVFNIYNNENTTASDASPPLLIYKANTTTSSSERFIQFYNAATPMGGIVGNGAQNVQFLTLSDEREKTNIAPVTGALGRIMQIQVSSFDRIGLNEHIKAGFVAQNVLPIYPEYVVDNVSNEGEEQRYGITGGMSAGFVAELTAALQELKNEFDAYKASHP